jgi:nitroimidazol reductase NimA-like FMN-containing flavoprotein (pyridoxamine 5'-phosphate oxidase superfamily)
MRVAKKEIHDLTVIEELLASSPVGRLGTIGRDGYPMIKPLNFVHHRGRIYLHSAPEGEKIEAILRDGRVCFEVDLPLAYVKSTESPCKADYLYRSVIIRGRAHIVTDREERVSALTALMRKYQPEGGYGAFPEEKLTLTAVVRIDIVEMTGKQDLGKENEREAVLRIIRHRPTPPAVLERS